MSNMIAAIVIEGLSDATGASRDQVQDVVNKIYSKFANQCGRIRRLVDPVLSADITDGVRATRVTAIAESLADSEIKQLVTKMLVGAAGVAIGVMLIAQMEIVAVVLGVVILWMAGSYTLSILRELWSRVAQGIDSFRL